MGLGFWMGNDGMGLVRVECDGILLGGVVLDGT